MLQQSVLTHVLKYLLFIEHFIVGQALFFTPGCRGEWYRAPPSHNGIISPLATGIHETQDVTCYQRDLFAQQIFFERPLSEIPISHTLDVNPCLAGRKVEAGFPALEVGNLRLCLMFCHYNKGKNTHVSVRFESGKQEGLIRKPVQCLTTEQTYSGNWLHRWWRN